MVSQQFACCICLPKDLSVKKVINKGQSAYRRTRASRSYQLRPECLPKDQSVKKVINNGQSAYRRTRVSRSYQQRPEYLPKDQSVKKLSTKARVPTKALERQEVISKGQSAYQSTRASRSYQQRPEVPNWSGQQTTDMMETTRG